MSWLSSLLGSAGTTGAGAGTAGAAGSGLAGIGTGAAGAASTGAATGAGLAGAAGAGAGLAGSAGTGAGAGIAGATGAGAATSPGWAGLLTTMFPQVGYGKNMYDAYKSDDYKKLLQNAYGMSQSLPQYGTLDRYRR